MGRWSQASMSQPSWARASREWHGLPNPRQRTRNWGACMPSASSASFNRPDENPGHEEEKACARFCIQLSDYGTETTWQWATGKRPNLDTRGSSRPPGAPAWCALGPQNGQPALGHRLLCFCVFCAGARARRGAARTRRRPFWAVCGGSRSG